MTHHISFHPRTSPVCKSSGLTPVLRNVPPQDCKNWLAHQPIVSPGIGQESSGILQEYVGDNKALTRTPLGHGPAPPSQPTTPLPVPTLFPQPSIQPSPWLVTPQAPPKLPLPLDSSWPTWFQKAYTGLSSTHLSAELTSAIRIYVDFEKTANFVVGSPNAGFKVDN